MAITLQVVSLKRKHAISYPLMLRKVKHWNLYQERQKQDTCLGPVNVSNPKALCLARQPPLPQGKAGFSVAMSLCHMNLEGLLMWGGKKEQLILGLWYKDRSRVYTFMPLWLFLPHPPGKALLFRFQTHNPPGKTAGSESPWLPRLIVVSGETIPSENVNTRLLFTSDTGSEPNLQVSPKTVF